MIYEPPPDLTECCVPVALVPTLPVTRKGCCAGCSPKTWRVRSLNEQLV